MESVLAELASEMQGKAVVGRVNESERKLFEAFGVRGIPAIFILSNAELKQSFTGSRPKDFLKKLLQEYGAR